MTVHEQQAVRLHEILPWAGLVGALRSTYQPEHHQVHLRPSGRGIRLVDLHPDRPQLDRGLISRHEGAVDRLRRLLSVTPTARPGRPTPEKRLQSWLMAEAYRAGGQLESLSSELILVTDEQRFPAEGGDFVCDLLALRGTTPVIVELKSARQMARLVEQLRIAAETVDAHRERFAELFGAVLARTVVLDRPCERWLVWPAAPGHEVDPRGDELARQGIHGVPYVETDGDYRFTAGPPARQGNANR